MKGATDALPDADLILMPLADGGEGTVSAIVNALGGEMVPVVVRGRLGRSRKPVRHGLRR